ncbi:hypothetical protein G3A43_07390 [Paraburkholderia aspalathi]|nr:hypothetical protein [Paraburkholderia aspalathi]MBK3780077.1 hypothetical protein [Paraburkholderia aspalathi]
MDIDELIALLQKRKEERGSIDVTTLEYAGGNDAVCDIVDVVFDEESGTLRVQTKYR